MKKIFLLIGIVPMLVGCSSQPEVGIFEMSYDIDGVHYEATNGSASYTYDYNKTGEHYANRYYIIGNDIDITVIDSTYIAESFTYPHVSIIKSGYYRPISGEFTVLEKNEKEKILIVEFSGVAVDRLYSAGDTVYIENGKLKATFSTARTDQL